jgi:acetyl-CoA carboxylase biotin carboxyl carrier protein
MPKKAKSTPSSNSKAGSVNLSEVERLLDFMDQHGLEEFEYERNGVRIRLKKPSASHPGLSRAMSFPEIVVPGDTRSGDAVGDPAASKPGHSAARQSASEAAISEDLHVVKSPIVGTFYGCPSPGADPFVTVGASVESGQVLCIIEAMKLMNEIESDVAGEVVRIFVENGQPVEYGEPLFGIHPHRKK